MITLQLLAVCLHALATVTVTPCRRRPIISHRVSIQNRFQHVDIINTAEKQKKYF